MGELTTVRLSGFKELDAALAALPRRIAGNVLTRALMAASAPLVATAKRLAPDDPRTGAPDLHTSIVALKAKNPKSVFGRIVYVGPTAEKIRSARTGRATGRWVAATELEFGTGDMPMKPFMRPAFEATKGQMLDSLKRSLAVEIEKAAARVAKRVGG